MSDGIKQPHLVVRFVLTTLLFFTCPLVWLVSQDDGWWITKSQKPRTSREWFRRWRKLMVIAAVVSFGAVVVAGVVGFLAT